MKRTLLVSIFGVVTLLAGPSARAQRLEAGAMTIADINGTPVAGAQVLIGEAADVPFTGNQLISDQEGRVTLPASWLDAQPVTIEALGFVRTTYMALMPSTATLAIRRPEQSVKATPRYELKGNTTGYGSLKNDGTFDVGLIVQAVPRSQLASISLTTFVSPEVDHITVLGQNADVPSNIAIPEQTESYIFPLKFNKPGYRVYLPSTGPWQISALHARMPFKATVDALQNGRSFLDLINSFEFVEGSIVDAMVAQASQTQDIAVNATRFSKSIPFKSPAFDPSLTLLAISLAHSKGAYYATDVKTVAPNANLQLAAPAGTNVDGMVLAAYKKSGTKSVGAESDQFSAVVLPNNENRPFDAIRLVDPPKVNADQLVLDTPTPPSDLNPVMTYAMLNIVTSTTQGKLKVENKQAQWDVWAPNWVNQLDLPQRELPTIDPKNQTLRWEVGFSAQFVGQKSAPPGPSALEKITHVTRSAVDL